MPSMKLTKRTIERLPAPDPSGKQTLYWDTELKGFGLLISGRTNSKSYIVQREVNGKSRRVTLGTVAEYATAGKSLKEAEEDAANLLLEMRKGKDPKAHRGPAANVTLRDVCSLYLTSRPNLSDRSKAGYEKSCERWLSAWLDMPLRNITADMVERRFREISEEVADRQAKSKRRAKGNVPSVPDRQATPGAASANGAMRTLRALWNFADDRVPELPPNPVARLRRQWHTIPPRERYVSGDDLKAFYAAVDAYPSRTMCDYIKLLLFTGLRRGEAAGLRWADVDFASRTIKLPARRTKAKRKLDLPMSDFVHGLLVTRRALGIENEFLFPGDGRNGHLQEPKKALIEIGQACGVYVSPHDLRRTFISVATNTEIPPLALKGLVNHAIGGDVTENYAQGFGVEQLRKPMQAVAKKLEKHCGIKIPKGVASMRRKEEIS